MLVAFHGPVRFETLAGKFGCVLAHTDVDDIYDPHQLIGL